jgi:NhaP-type Na+/H+ or K+/H+ antiporter
MDSFVTTIALIGIVVVVASLLSSTLERRAVPLVVVFLAIGVLLGPGGLGLVDIGFDSPELRALAVLALALVLFTDAVTLDLVEVRSRRRLVLTLIGPGTLLPAVLLSVAAIFLLDLPVPAAAILGAALASTDPVLLRGALRSRALPENTRIALRMETGMNDILLLPIVVIAALMLKGSGGAPIEGAAGRTIAQDLVGLFLLGPVLGVLVGWFGITALSRVRSSIGVRRDYESLYALGLAFCAFAAAESVGGSGFVAAFAAGFMIDARDTELCDCFMEYGEATAEMFLLLTFVALGTHVIWTGLDVIHGRTLLFALIALGVRTAVLYPMLGGLGLPERDRRLIAWMGPRGLSSLLLALLPVFAGAPGAEGLFSVACLVVLLSLVVHGGGIAWLIRLKGATAPSSSATSASPATSVAAVGSPPAAEAERITLDELRELERLGQRMVIADARKDASYYGEGRKAAGAVRLDRDDPVRDAEVRKLPRDAIIAVYCA